MSRDLRLLNGGGYIDKSVIPNEHYDGVVPRDLDYGDTYEMFDPAIGLMRYRLAAKKINGDGTITMQSVGVMV